MEDLSPTSIKMLARALYRTWPKLWLAIVTTLLSSTFGCSEQSDTNSAPTQTQAQPRPAQKPTRFPRELGAVMQAISQRRYDFARNMTEEYIQNNPQDSHGYFTLGYSYHHQGNYSPAVPYFEKALELSPDYKAAHHFFGECLFLLGEMDASRAQHEAHRDSDQAEPDALYGIGLVDLEESKLEVAEARFKEAIVLYDEMKKTNRRLYDSKQVGLARCHARLADVYFARDNYEAARDELITTIAISPGTISALYTLSVVYRRLGEDQLAEETLGRYESAKSQIINRQRERGE